MPLKRQTRVFIVRLWMEPREIEDGARQWRGSIELVPTGERKFVNGVGQIGRAIETYLEQSKNCEESRE